jgi:hypothetical protein
LEEITGYSWEKNKAKELTMIFQNTQIVLTSLPAVEAVEFQRLAPAYRNVEYVGTAIYFGFLFIGWVVLFFVTLAKLPWLGWSLLALWVVLFALSMYLAGRRYEVSGYALREHDIIHRYGVLTRVVTTVPFNRMQHCEISRGPVESAFGLATLRVFTAGGASSDLSIEGLLHEEAQRIKEFITRKIGENKEGRLTA